jgi:hypothetical protein
VSGHSVYVVMLNAVMLNVVAPRVHQMSKSTKSIFMTGLELCSDQFSVWLCQPGVLNKDPTVWLKKSSLVMSLGKSKFNELSALQYFIALDAFH